MKSPTKEEVVAARKLVGITQAHAATLVHSALRSWQQWEAGHRKMHPAIWELFQIKTRIQQPG